MNLFHSHEMNQNKLMVELRGSSTCSSPQYLEDKELSELYSFPTGQDCVNSFPEEP